MVFGLLTYYTDDPMMADIFHLGFSKIRILAAIWSIKMAILSHHAKFRDDLSNRCRDMAIYQFCKITTVRHLRFT